MKDFGPAIQKAGEAYRRGDWAGAETICRRVLRAKTDHFDALTLLGIVAAQTGRAAQAAALFSRAVRANPREASAHSNLGNALRELGQFDEALSSYDRAIPCQPDDAEVHYNRGLALQELQRWNAALESYDRAVSFNPDYAEAYCNRGLVLQELGRFDEALDSYDCAIKIRPDLAEAHSNRGITLRDLGRLDEALQSYDRAIQLKPDYAEPHCNRGNALKSLNRLREALACYELAIQIRPDYAEAHWGLSVCSLLLGDFARGWAEHEWRWHARDISKRLVTDRTRFAGDWDGNALQGTLLVLPEQGVGDEIFYAGMLNDLRTRAASVTVCVDPRLVKLYQRSFANMTFVAKASITPGQPFAAQVYMASLGRYFRGSPGALENIKVPYLRACARRAESLRARIKDGEKLLCGLSWLSKNAYFGADKSLNLADLAPLLSLAHVDFVDLQYGDTHVEQAALGTATGIPLKRIAEIDNFNDIDGLAALIAACDIVLTVSNTTAHLAAALGKPVLVMLPYSAGLLWYWQLDREDSAWYPSARLFRQERIGDWTSVIERVRLALLR